MLVIKFRDSYSSIQELYHCVTPSGPEVLINIETVLSIPVVSFLEKIIYDIYILLLYVIDSI